MGKMDGMSMDLKAENIAQLKALFPEAVTEGKVDFEVLKALLGGEIEQRQEYYKFTWNGKEAARAYARTRSMGTLRPCVEESSGKDGTPGKFDSENLYIEGDNLEVLKLLQGPYHKRVKMIYIDPPYNTGHDFVYPDNFKDSIGNYKALTGQTDDEGKSTRANPETSGRYHTDWLNMMYPRLILARNLLTDDGVIFISIDKSEDDNLKKLCNEVFGEENYLTTITRATGTPTGGGFEAFVNELDYIVVFAKSSSEIRIRGLEFSEEDSAIYNQIDSDGKKYLTRSLRRTGGEDRREDRPSMYYPVIAPDGTEVFPLGPTGYESRWICGKDKYEEMLANGLIEWKKNNATGQWSVYQKFYLENRTKQPGNLWTSEDGNKKGTREIRDSFNDKKVFDFPKPLGIVRKMINLSISQDENAIILDFFSGSATTAHAVEQLNAEDGGNRKYIMVQLPEVCEDGSEAAKAGYSNICEIGKERIRRAAKKIKGEHPDWKGDMGFKVFKLDTSNLLPWNPVADELEQNLFAAVDNVLEGRSTDDLLHEILLKCNLPLTLPIETKQCGSNTIYLVGAGALAICLDKNIPASIAEEIVKLRDEYAPIVPMQVVFRDNGFNDVTKTNALQILKQAGFEEKSIQTI